jgi:hypothetical protein
VRFFFYYFGGKRAYGSFYIRVQRWALHWCTSPVPFDLSCQRKVTYDPSFWRILAGLPFNFDYACMQHLNRMGRHRKKPSKRKLTLSASPLALALTPFFMVPHLCLIWASQLKQARPLPCGRASFLPKLCLWVSLGKFLPHIIVSIGRTNTGNLNDVLRHWTRYLGAFNPKFLWVSVQNSMTYSRKSAKLHDLFT